MNCYVDGNYLLQIGNNKLNIINELQYNITDTSRIPVLIDLHVSSQQNNTVNVLEQYHNNELIVNSKKLLVHQYGLLIINNTLSINTSNYFLSNNYDLIGGDGITANDIILSTDINWELPKWTTISFINFKKGNSEYIFNLIENNIFSNVKYELSSFCNVSKNSIFFYCNNIGNIELAKDSNATIFYKCYFSGYIPDYSGGLSSKSNHCYAYECDYSYA
jgi:hypothetical protein